MVRYSTISHYFAAKAGGWDGGGMAAKDDLPWVPSEAASWRRSDGGAAPGTAKRSTGEERRRRRPRWGVW